MTTANQVYTWLLTEATSSDLERMDVAIRNRREILGATGLRPGSKARLTMISPKYMEGRECVVVRRKTKNYVVRFDSPLPGRFHGMTELTVPATCLIPLS